MLDHPNIVKLYEVLESPSDIYMVMEYIHGDDLSEWANRQRKKKDFMDQVAPYYILLMFVPLASEMIKLSPVCLPGSNPHSVLSSALSAGDIVTTAFAAPSRSFPPRRR